MNPPNWEEALNQFKMVIDCGTESMRIKAITKLAQLSKNTNTPEYILTRTLPILANLISHHHPSSTTPSLVRSSSTLVVHCLNCIAARGDDGTLAADIAQSGALQSILRLLPESDAPLQRVCVKCLWRLLNFGNNNNGIRLIVARNGGLEIVVNMLTSSTDEDDDGIRRYLLEILSALSLLREIRRGLVVSLAGGLVFLVEAARYGNMLSRERACQAIGLLGVTRRARRMLVELGVIPVLVELLRLGDTATKLVAANSLGVFSAHVDYLGLVAQAGAIPLLAQLIEEGSQPLGQAQAIAEDVFCLLAVDEANAVSIVQHLVRILREGDSGAKAAAANVLWDLAGYKHSLPVVRNSGAIPHLVELLGSQSSEVRETVSGAIAQLSYDEADREALIASGAVNPLVELLHDDDSEEVRDNAVEALINFYEDPMQHERITPVVDLPSFQSMRNRLNRIRAYEDQTVRSMRQMSIDHDLV